MGNRFSRGLCSSVFAAVFATLLVVGCKNGNHKAEDAGPDAASGTDTGTGQGGDTGTDADADADADTDTDTDTDGDTDTDTGTHTDIDTGTATEVATDTESSLDSETASESDSVPVTNVCDEFPALPKTSRIWTSHFGEGGPGLTADFVFDAAGNLVTVDGAGNVVRETPGGERTIWVEKAVKTARGMAFLSTGDLVIADSGTGSLVKVRPDGDTATVIMTLDYPNGVDVDLDDYVYVSEFTSGAIRRINPKTGDSQYIAKHLPVMPGGLSFSPDYAVLFFVGYGNGTVYALRRSGDGSFGEPELFATVPGGADLCAGRSPYDACGIMGTSIGVCTPDHHGGVFCQTGGGCAGEEAGTACEDSLYGESGTCELSKDGAMFCDPVWPCSGKSEGDPCDVYWDDSGGDWIDDDYYGDSTGECAKSDIGLLYCVQQDPCEGKADGDGCTLPWAEPGICVDFYGALECVSGFPCYGRSVGEECTTRWGDGGICIDEGDDTPSCQSTDACDGLTVGEGCYLDWYGYGNCKDFGDGRLFCDQPDPCDGLAEGESCTSEWGIPGICEEVGVGRLFCKEIAPCDGKSDGDDCTTLEGRPGRCEIQGYDYYDDYYDDDYYGEMDTGMVYPPDVDTDTGGVYLYCRAVDDCAGREAGDDCTTTWDSPGRCVVVSEEDEMGADTDGEWKPVADTGNEMPPLPAGAPGIDGGLIDADAGMDGGDSPEVILACREPEPCDGLEAGDQCANPSGDVGTCVESYSGHVYCETPPPCGGKVPGDTCRETGTCADDLFGDLYCQGEGQCDDLSEGEPCLDMHMSEMGTCVERTDGGLYCEAENPCRGAEEGADCMMPWFYYSGGRCAMGEGGGMFCQQVRPCDSKYAGDPCTGREGTEGVCIEYEEGELRCEGIRPCRDLEVGDPCETDDGERGICQSLWDYYDDYYGYDDYYDYGYGGYYEDYEYPDEGVSEDDVFDDDYYGYYYDELYCQSVPPCYDMEAGDSCRGQYGVAGTCVEDDDGELGCELPPPCESKEVGTSCLDLATGLQGTCIAGGGDVIVCQPGDSCEGKASGDPCGLTPDDSGTCVGSGDDSPLWCYRFASSGLLEGINTDICGNVYVTDSASDAVWRFTPDGSVTDLLTNALRTPVTSLAWGSGVDGWNVDAIYLGIDGTKEIVTVPLGVPGRPLAGDGSVIHPDDNPGQEPTPIFNCLDIPEVPLSVAELDKPRGYHDLAFDSEGYVIGSDNFNLVRVSYDNRVQLFATGLENVEGMDWLSDGSLVVASGSQGLVRIAPNGSKSTLASSIRPYGVTTGPDDRIYAADNNRVYRVDPASGEVEVLIDPSKLSFRFNPRGVEFDPDYSLMYLTTLDNSDIYVVAVDDAMDPVGEPRWFATIPGSTYQDGLGVDICGNLYVPVYDDSVLYRVTPDGKVSAFYQFNFSQYGHGLQWGSGVGGFDDTALYLPQPYDDNTVVELKIGVPSRKYVPPSGF